MAKNALPKYVRAMNLNINIVKLICNETVCNEAWITAKVAFIRKFLSSEYTVKPNGIFPIIYQILFKEKTGMEMGGNKNAKERGMFNLSNARKIENYCEIL
jgi:hypothetical protein